MFERFTGKARPGGRRGAGAGAPSGRDRIRTEHLLAGAVRRAGQPGADGAGRVRRRPGRGRSREHRPAAPRRRCRSVDAEALATLGIDLDEVRRQVEEAFGPGALDRTRAAPAGRRAVRRAHPVRPGAKKALELALREAMQLKHNYIGTEHILLGLLHAEGGAARHDPRRTRGAAGRRPRHRRGAGRAQRRRGLTGSSVRPRREGVP